MIDRLRSAWRASAPYVIPAAVFLVVLLAMFWRLWTPIDGARRGFGWDAQWEYWGDLQFQLDAWASGEMPLWNPFDRAGYPFHADPQAGVLYPVTWLLLGLGALLGGAPWWLIAVKTILHFWIGALGVYAFLRRRGVARFACYAGGFVFVFTYPFMHNSFSALNWSMAWAPWALLAVDAWSERPSFGRAALVAGALGMGELAGAMASFWYTLIVVVPYGVWAVVHHARRAEDRRAWLRQAATSVAIAVGIFVALVVAQLHATQGLVPQTVRDTRNLDFIGVTAFTADDLLAFAVPRFPGENTYMGFAALIWTAAAVSLRPKPRNLVLAGIAVAGVLCAWGNLGPFLPFGASWIPPFGFFRRAHRYLYVTVLALSILSAEGLAALFELKGRALRRRVAFVVLVLTCAAVTIFGVAFAVKATTPHKVEAYREAWGFGLAAALVGGWLTIMVVWTRGRTRAVFAVIAVVALLFDLAHSQTPKLELNWFEVPKTPRDRDARKLPGVPLEARVYDREVLKYRPGIRLGIRDLGGYEGDPLALRRFASFLEAARAKPTLLAHANVRWLLEGGKTRTKPSIVPKTGLSAAQGRSGVYEVPDATPFVLWIDAATIVRDAGAALTKLKTSAPGTVALVEEGTLPASDRAAALEDTSLPPVAGRVVSFRRNRVEVAVDAPAAGIVVVHEAFYPGWRATVDGRPATIVPANGLFRGVVVPAGRHTIVMTYPATAYKALAPLSLLGWAAIALLVWRDRRRARATR